MGVCLSLTFDKSFPEGDSFSKFTDGKDLVDAMDRLDALCRKEDVTLFSGFAPDYDSLAEGLKKGESLDEIWFSSGDGLRTVSRLICATASDKEWSRGLAKSRAKLVIDCLKEIERLLKIGKRRKAKFYFLYY